MHAFARTATQLQGDRLPEWTAAATPATTLPSLRRLAQHLEHDLAAATADLSQPWNSGIMEDHVNRTKMINHQKYGRAMGSNRQPAVGSVSGSVCRVRTALVRR